MAERLMIDSGIDWIKEIPSNWDIYKVKKAFVRKDAKAEQDDPIVLSLARDGVKIRDISNNEGQLAESYYNYNPVEPGDLLLNPMDLYSGANCSLSKVSGVISPAYMNLRAKEGFDPRFYDYYFKTQYWGMALFAHGKGVSFDNRWTLGRETLMNYFIPHPAYEEQARIADFLDKKVSEIDTVISKTKESIEEYKKLKQSIITEAVTKGLDPNVEMKDSGIKWIGQYPETWKLAELKMFVAVNNGKEIENEVEKTENAIDVYGSGGVFKYTDKYMYDGEAVLFGRKGTLGKPLYVNQKFWTVDTMYYLTMKEGLLSKYNYYQLIAFDWEPYITHTALPSVVASEVVSQKFPIPSKKEQEQIVDYLDGQSTKYDSLISKKEQVITELEQYKKSLIYEYVTGKKEVA